MSQNFSARYTLTFDDFDRFSDAYVRLTKPRRVSLAALAIIDVLMFAAALYLLWTGDVWFGLYFLGLALLLLLLRYPVQPWVRRYQFAHQRVGEHEITMTANEDGLSSSSALVSGTAAWPSIRHVDDLPEHVLLWPNNRMGYIVPKRAFASADEADAFVRFAKEKTAGQHL